VPRSHAPAVVMGLLPGLAGWSAFMAKSGLRAAGMGLPGGAPFDATLIDRFARSDLWIDGALRLEQGFIISAMVLAAATVAVIERQFLRAATWCLGAALLTMAGLMHAYRWTPGDTVLELAPAWPWVEGYCAMAICFALARWLTVPLEDGEEIGH
jgi:AGZA family xanthine/uracil permease-like MFS transporter